MPFTLYVNCDKTNLHTFQPFFLNRDIIQVYDQFLLNTLLQTANETNLLYAQFLHQNSNVGQIISFLEPLKENTVSI